MKLQEIQKELINIIEDTVREIDRYKYFTDGTPKFLTNNPAIESLSEVALKLVNLGEKIEKGVNEV